MNDIHEALNNFEIVLKIYEFLSAQDQLSLSKVRPFDKFCYDFERHNIKIQMNHFLRFLKKQPKSFLMKGFIKHLTKISSKLDNAQELKKFMLPLSLLCDHRFTVCDIIYHLKDEPAEKIFPRLLTNLMIGITTSSEILDRLNHKYAEKLLDCTNYETLFLRVLILCNDENVAHKEFDNFFIDCYSLEKNVQKMNSILDIVIPVLELNFMSEIISFLRRAFLYEIDHLINLLNTMNKENLVSSQNAMLLLNGCLGGNAVDNILDTQIMERSRKVFPFLNQLELDFYLRFFPLNNIRERLWLIPESTKGSEIIATSYILRAPQHHLDHLLQHFTIRELIKNESLLLLIENKNIITIKHFIQFFKKRQSGDWFLTN